ncbi:MAG: SMP-30/gluconolactonase/LRE family protein [Granulosicoccus sp.]
MQADLVLGCQNEHGEGIFWNSDDGCLWWTDIEGRCIWSHDPESGENVKYPTPDRVCSFAPRRDGGFIVAFADRISLFNLNTGNEQIIHHFEPNNPDTRLNDGRTDRQGRFIVGGMNEGSGAANSSMLRVDHDLSVSMLFDGVSCANSTCFSPDGKTLFFADTPDRQIVAYDYDTINGNVSNRRLHCHFIQEPGLPDGSCVDAQGGVWNAEWEGRRVVRIAPDGTIDQVIDVPVWKPTCCAFGGANLETLFITTSRLFSSEQVLAAEPDSGGLYAVKPGVRGIIDKPFYG